MWAPKPNMIVEVESLGRAKIIKIIGNKALISLENFNHLQIEIEVSKISPINSQNIENITNAKNATLGTKMDYSGRKTLNIEDNKLDNSIQRIRTIESLRFGLVPEHHIEYLTLGFNDIKEWAIDTFNKCVINQPCGFEISGPYGTGKSHTLSIIRYLARKQGFLTAHVEVDGQNISFSNPSMLLNNLWRTLAENGIDSDNPLVNLYTKAINNGNIPQTIITSGQDRIKNNLKTIYTLIRTGNIDKYAHIVESIISCSDEFTVTQAKKEIFSEFNIDRSQIRIEPMVSKTVSKRGFDLVESLAGHAVLAKLAGFKGLIITIDEFEIEYYDKKNHIRVEEILNTIGQYLNGNTIYYKAPLGIYIATVDQYGYQGDPLIQRYIAPNELNRYRLRVWEQEQRVKLAEKIHKIYCEAYNLENPFDKSLASKIERLLAQKIENDDSGLIRSFIKWYVGLLDLKYGPPKEKVV